jgi:Glycosyl transferase family 2
MKWSILILTMPERYAMLSRLMLRLMPQLKGRSDIEIIVRTFDSRFALGENRELLRNMSSGEYINFIDDDDLVSADYVAKIYPLLDGTDYISFPVQCYVDGQESWTFTYCLKYLHVYGPMDQSRDISPLHPMRRDLALMVPMEGGREEDIRWANGIRNLNLVRNEYHIEKILYHYYYLTNKVETLHG